MRVKRKILEVVDARGIAFGITSVAVTAAFVLGGGARQGLWQDAWLQLIAVPLLASTVVLVIALWDRETSKWPLWLSALLIALPLLQLLPLPEKMLQLVPLQKFAMDLRMDAIPAGNARISLSPAMTARAALSLIVPITVLLGTWLCSYAQRRWLSLGVVFWGILNALLGMMQVSQGQQSALRFFEVTNPTDAVGLFANRNHLSAFLNATMPFLLAWLFFVVAGVRKSRNLRNVDAGKIFALVLLCIGILIVVVGQLTSRSRGGLLLFLLLAAAFAIIGLRGTRGTSLWRVVAGGGIALGILLLFAPIGVIGRVGDDPLQESRLVFAQRTVAAIKASFPIGAGMGTFERIYPIFERPQDTLIDTYVNRAHNDLLELTLESGFVGPIILLLFSIWLIMAALRISRIGLPNGSSFDGNLALAAFALCAITLLHSLVDYPLRTGAVSAVVALACAMLCAPPGARSFAPSIEDFTQSSRPSRRSSSAALPPEPSATPVGPREEWRPAEGGWPDEWKTT